MPPPLLCNLDELDLDRVAYTREQLYAKLPHRHEFISLDAVIHVDLEAKVAVAYRDIKKDDWWVRGHVPGQPIFPGVLMLETAAHLSAFMMRYMDGYEGFVAFGGVDKCKFRDAVTPPARMYMICKQSEDRPRRITGDCQAVVNGALVFEARITGLPIANQPQ